MYFRNTQIRKQKLISATSLYLYKVATDSRKIVTTTKINMQTINGFITVKKIKTFKMT